MRFKSLRETSFNDDWLNDPLFQPWLEKKKQDGKVMPNLALCKICSATINLSNMGKRAITSHMEGKKHLQRAHQVSIQHFFPKSSDTSSPSGSLPADTNSAPCAQTVDDSNVESPPCKCSCRNSATPRLEGLVRREEVTKTEVLWCLNAVKHHRSLNSASEDVTLFTAMFPDSLIADSMQLQRTKMSYNIVYGLAPYFKSQLVDKLKLCEFYTIGFDESFNKISNKGQMDLSVRYYDEQVEETRVSYLSSAFLGHATAQNLLSAFLDETRFIDLNKLLQVSMDGPSVNLKFFRELKEFLKDDHSSVLLDLGTCGLHSLNNAFKEGIKATGWLVISYLTNSYYLFYRSPARRADYTYLTGSCLFAEKYCTIRWLENYDVAEKGIKMLPFTKKYLEKLEMKDCEIKPPKNKSFANIKSACESKLLLPRLRFFQSLSLELQPFLTYFQGDQPLAPYLYRKVLSVLKSVFICFLKPEFMNSKDIRKIKITDLEKESNLLPAKSIGLSFDVKEALRSAGPFSQNDLLKFREDCKLAYVTLRKKILQRSPLTLKLTKAISFLDPKVAESRTTFKNRSNDCLEILVQHSWLAGSEADCIRKQLFDVVGDRDFVKIMKSFSPKTSRLDTFWIGTVFKRNSDLYGNSIRLVKMICTLAHGNAWLERGFSANKEMLVPNLKESSLLAQRSIYDRVKDVDLKTFKVDSKCLSFIRNSRSLYEMALKSERLKIENEQDSRKKRKLLAVEIENLKAKKKKTTEEFCTTTNEIENTLREKQKLLDKI